MGKKSNQRGPSPIAGTGEPVKVVGPSPIGAKVKTPEPEVVKSKKPAADAQEDGKTSAKDSHG